MISRSILMLRRLLAGRGGSAAVEFALILPFMTLLCFAFVGTGRLFWNYHIAVSAVRTNAGDAVKVQNVARTGVGDGTGSPLIASWTSNASVVVTVSCVSNTGGAYSGRYEDMTGVPIVQVSASPPYIDSFGPLTGISLTSFTVSAQQAWTE
jgi:Flp pilus assembly protein TadG